MTKRGWCFGPVVLGLLTIAPGCGGPMLRFSLRDPLWVDADEREFSPRPPEWYSPYIWDGIDNSATRPLAEAFALELDHEATNVNALDEVPSSSWFTNRLSRGALPPARVARGACDDSDPSIEGVDDDVRGPFTITRGKPDGSSRGFFVRDRNGVMYLMKPDGELQPERPSAADAIGAAVFWTAGYFVPCNRVIYVEPSALSLDPEAEVSYTDGRTAPLTQQIVDEVLEHAAPGPGGTLRFSLSRFLDGEPISPWTYAGTWDADPNDIVPHQDRRDVRGMFVLSAWLSHIDSRQENTMAAWIGEGDRGHVRHYMLDFSDTLGILHASESLSTRFGHSGYLDAQFIVEDFLTLGLIDRPWHDAEHGPAGVTLGYFDAERFQPDQWRPGYPNPAYERMTEHDAAWMARIVARFGDAQVHALVQRGRFTDGIVSAELERILIVRRDRILERWLTRLSPLTEPRIEQTPSGSSQLCLEDRAVTSGFRDASGRRYEARAWGLDSRSVREVQIEQGAEGVCVRVGAGERASDYVVVEVVARTEGAETTGPIRVHAYELDGALRVVGLERLEHSEAPPS